MEEQGTAAIGSIHLKAELTTWMGNITATRWRGGPGVSLLVLITLKNLSGDKPRAHRRRFYSREEKQTLAA